MSNEAYFVEANISIDIANGSEVVECIHRIIENCDSEIDAIKRLYALELYDIDEEDEEDEDSNGETLTMQHEDLDGNRNITIVRVEKVTDKRVLETLIKYIA